MNGHGDDPSSPTLERGCRLGHYVVAERLGAGGMGEVYRARDTKLRRDVALKVLPRRLTSDTEVRRRFEGEARAVAALNHPNIVTVHSVESAQPEPESGVAAEGPLHFLTMELVRGPRLSDLLERRGLPLDTFYELALPLASAVGAAHDAGIIHRDLKPMNVLVTPGPPGNRIVKVLDFGLAKVMQQSVDETAEPTAAFVTHAGQVMGTPAYMSPEQAEGRSVDARSDVFSLGIMLFEVLTGSRPFPGDSRVAVLAAIVSAEAPRLESLRTDIPTDLAGVVGRCLAKDPSERFASARELLAALAACAGAAAASPPTTARAAGPSRAGVGLWSTVIALLVAVFAAAWYWSSEPDDGAGPPESYSAIAVLPLESLSAEGEDQQWFADGMTETLITELSRIGTLKVISRTSVMRYRNAETPIAEIADELRVEAVVRGSTLRVGDDVRISAQIIDARTDSNLWAGDYDGTLANVLGLQRDVAREIADQVRARLGPESLTNRADPRPVAPEATVAYLRALHAFNNLRFSEAEELVRAAIAEDRSFAPAHDLLAQLLHVRWDFGQFGTPESATAAVAEARESAHRALSLDPDLGRAWALLGWSRMVVDYDWEQSGADFARGYDLDPSTGNLYGFWLSARGRYAEAVEAAERAAERDPANPLILTDVARIHVLSRRQDRGIEGYRHVLRMEDGSDYARYWLYADLYAMGRETEAFEAFEEFVRGTDAGSTTADRSTVVGARRVDEYRRTFRSGGWRGVWELLFDRSSQIRNGRLAARSRLRAAAALGRTAEAVAQLRYLKDLGDPWLVQLQDRLYDAFRDDPAFQALLRELEYPEMMWQSR